jgi:hypothetical protein
MTVTAQDMSIMRWAGLAWTGKNWKGDGSSLAHNLQLLVSVKRYQFLQHVLQQTSELSTVLMVGVISLFLTTYDALQSAHITIDVILKT